MKSFSMFPLNDYDFAENYNEFPNCKTKVIQFETVFYQISNFLEHLLDKQENKVENYELVLNYLKDLDIQNNQLNLNYRDRKNKYTALFDNVPLIMETREQFKFVNFYKRHLSNKKFGDIELVVYFQRNSGVYSFWYVDHLNPEQVPVMVEPVWKIVEG